MFPYQARFEAILGRKLNPKENGEAPINCPNHNDQIPSLSLNCRTGEYYCHACCAGGKFYSFETWIKKGSSYKGGLKMGNKNKISKIDEGQEERIERMLKDAAAFYHRQLINAKEGNLADRYLISRKIARKLVSKYQIGLACKNGLYEYLNTKGYSLEEQIQCGLVRKHGNKVMDVFQDSIIFPVYKNTRAVYLVARQLIEGTKPKYLNIKRTIKWLYNEDMVANTARVIIVEGIPDGLTLIQYDYPAIGTLGAGLFKPEFKEKFTGVKDKFQCLDNDYAGFNGMKKVDEIFNHDIKVIALPKGIKDVNEFFQKHTKEDFDALIKKAKWFENYALDREAIKEIHLIDIESSENINKRVKVTFRVAGVGSVYFVPIRFRVHYKDASNIDQSQDFVIPQNSVVLLKMCKASKEAQLNDCKKFAKPYFGSSIRIESIEVLDYISMTQILALPKIKELKVGASGEIITEEGKEYRQKVVYFQGVKNTTSKLYDALGYVVADPLTSEARFLVSDYEEVRERFDEFRITSGIIRQFESLKRRDNESIDDFLDKLAESVAYRFIRIYGEARKDAIIASLLCFHSPLYFYYEGELVNAWLQIGYIGDSTTGKTQIPKRIRNYVDAGVYVTGETCSRTGFLYCIDTKTLSACILTWGLLPQQDRSLLIIDGANYINAEDWGTAREARRSGKLIVERVVKGEHPCRPRLILAANPSKPLNQYIYPIEGIKDVFQEPDIARLDLCVCFSGSDVPKEEINMPQEERPVPEMNIDQEAFKNSVFWVWSRKIDDIIIKEDVVTVINSVANNLIDKFGSATDIPLVSNDVKFKVARLSVALACLLHSTDKEHEKVIVTSEIVQAIQRFIERVYSAPNCKFDRYASDSKAVTDITPEEFNAIQTALLEESKKDRSNILTELINMFRTNTLIRLNEISAKLDKSDSTIKSKLVFFKRFSLIRSGKSGYAKTQKFIQFLNKLEQEKKALPPLPSQ